MKEGEVEEGVTKRYSLTESNQLDVEEQNTVHLQKELQYEPAVRDLDTMLDKERYWQRKEWKGLRHTVQEELSQGPKERQCFLKNRKDTYGHLQVNYVQNKSWISIWMTKNWGEVRKGYWGGIQKNESCWQERRGKQLRGCWGASLAQIALLFWLK